tara:strand:+ start:2850 stop:3125 length:276 start_codon:yes stop_codon:yes gene_type:complete
MLSFAYSKDSTAQSTKTKGYNYKAHSQCNSKHAKINAKRFKAAGGDLTKMKCGKKRRKKAQVKQVVGNKIMAWGFINTKASLNLSNQSSID